MKKDKDGFWIPDSVEEWLQVIVMIACDYDGYNTVNELKSLIDELVEYANKARDCLKENKLYEVEDDKPKLNQPDVEQSTTDINLETQDIIDSQYVTKKFEMVNSTFVEKHHQWPVNEVWACRNCKARGQTFSSQTLHYCPHCGMYWGD